MDLKGAGRGADSYPAAMELASAFIDDRFLVFDDMRVSDDPSARQALLDVMALVAEVNQAGRRGDGVPEVDLGDPIKRLKKWLDRLVDKLTEIVEKLIGAVSFSISVGTGISVTVTFGPTGA
jgi:hypothetical protein